MRDVPSEDLLTVIGCEIDRRPAAPTIVDLAPLTRHVLRTPGALTVEFAAGSLSKVEAFAAAERQCCGGIEWTVASGPPISLTIATDTAALDALEDMIKTSI